MSTLTDLLVGLALDAGGDDVVIRAAIDDILAENGMGDEVPGWFVDFWRALVEGRRLERLSTPDPADASPGADISNALAELALVLPIERDDYGEGVVLVVPSRQSRGFISREGRDGGWTYEVEPTGAAPAS